MTQARLLLVEFFFPDRYSQFRSRNFPFLLGQAKSLGVAARWLCCWTPAGRTSRERFIVDEDDVDTASLEHVLRTFRPTHLIISERLGDGLDARIRRLAPGVVIENLSDAPARRLVAWPASWLPRWLAPDAAPGPGDRQVMDEVGPDYTCEAVGRRPGTGRPPVHILAGPDCTYQKKLRENPFYRDLELAEARPFGCSFCVGPVDLAYPFETPPVDLAMRQLRAASEQEDSCLDLRRFVVGGAPLFRRLGRFFEAALTLALAPSAFFLSCRIDQFLAQGPALEALLPRLEAAGHTINIFNMGIENFSDAENERLNKGLTTDSLEQADALIRRLEAAHPNTFRFTAWGGYGLILFTPWTTLDDLSCNLRFFRRFKGIEAEGFALTSKLQILSESAIRHLAEADGLLVEGQDDFHYYDSGCMFRHDQREVFWRFQNAGVALLYRIACRLSPITRFPDDDALLPAVQQLFDRYKKRGQSAFDLFEDALDLLNRDPTISSPEALLAALAPDLVDGPTRVPEPGPFGGGASPSAPESGGPTPSAVQRARKLLAGMQPAAGWPGGFVARQVDHKIQGTSDLELIFEFERAEEKLILHILPYDPEKPGFLRTRDLLLRYNESTPIDAVDKEQLAWIFLAGLQLNSYSPKADDDSLPPDPIHAASEKDAIRLVRRAEGKERTSP